MNGIGAFEEIRTMNNVDLRGVSRSAAGRFEFKCAPKGNGPALKSILQVESNISIAGWPVVTLNRKM